MVAVVVCVAGGAGAGAVLSTGGLSGGCGWDIIDSGGLVLDVVDVVDVVDEVNVVDERVEGSGRGRGSSVSS